MWGKQSQLSPPTASPIFIKGILILPFFIWGKTPLFNLPYRWVFLSN